MKRCDTRDCPGFQSKNYRFCPACLDDKRFLHRWGKTKEMVKLEMALNRKELEAITRDAITMNAMTKKLDTKYDHWARGNQVIPTLKNDPDFSPGKNFVWNDGTMKWQKQAIADNDEAYERMKRDFAIHQGEGDPVELETVAEATIHMMQNSEDDWNGALDILYGEDNETE